MTFRPILASKRILLLLLQQYSLVHFGTVALRDDRSANEACRRERPLCASAANSTAIGPLDCAQRPLVFILAGQSNMDGVGVASELERLWLEPLSAVYCVRAGFATGPLRPGYGFASGFFGPELTAGMCCGVPFPSRARLSFSKRRMAILHCTPPGRRPPPRRGAASASPGYTQR